MAELDINKSTTTNLDSEVSSYQVDTHALDYAGDQDENYHLFSKATEYFGYYKNIPELKKAVDALAMWTTGKGFTAEDTRTELILEYINGWGEDTIDSIFENLLIVKKIIGDSFAEIIREKDGEGNDRIINLKPISPERVRIVVGKKGLIKRYDIMNSDGKWKPFKKEDIFHLCNDRIGDEIHGTSVIESCKKIIDARNEALEDEQKIKHRELALGVMYVDSDKEADLDKVKSKYKDAVEKGEVLVLPKDVAEIQDTGVTPQERLNWIQYLENFFYQAVGIPKIILGGSQEFTEASSKVGYLTFEQVYMAEQRKLEQDIWQQLGLKIKFERPVSIKEGLQADEEKNTGQVGFQPKEGNINMERE